MAAEGGIDVLGPDVAGEITLAKPDERERSIGLERRGVGEGHASTPLPTAAACRALVGMRVQIREVNPPDGRVPVLDHDGFLLPESRPIMRYLDELVPEVPIPLEHVDPFTLLVAVVLSAQATDIGVNRATSRLFAAVKTPAEMLSLGEAGSAGFGSIRAGATERSNVDLTQELVDLITAQRNFQANAKAIETSSTMTQAIVNIRS